jgi:TrmH family RNA methyltransferase
VKEITHALMERVCLVLVRARNPNNIGAVARAMHGFGFADLRLVNDYPVSLERARSAVDADELLQSARLYPSVAEAVADCRLIVGTTAVGERALEHPVHTLASAGDLIRASASLGQVALLFGSEKTGLSNEAMSYCHWLLTIPMQEHSGVRHPSMNLGQAAAVCLYELVRSAEKAPRGADAAPLAVGSDVERVSSLLGEVLGLIGYAKRRPASAEPAEVRRMVHRLSLTQSDARRWIGVLRQVLWRISG